MDSTTASETLAPEETTTKFNHDLLVGQVERTLAASAYGNRVAALLDFPSLREKFGLYEKRAKKAKRRARSVGIGAIVMGTAALVTATGSSLLLPESEPGATIYWTVSALLGICSIIVGAWGLRLAGYKERWLCNRLMAERLRQFHFQAIVRLLPLVSSDLQNGTRRFSEERDAQFAAFLARHENSLKTQLSRVLADEAHKELWIVEEATGALPQTADGDLGRLLKAYRDLRFTHQIDFAHLKIRKEKQPLSMSDSTIYTGLEVVSLLTVVFALVVNIAIAGSAIGPSWWPWPGLEQRDGVHATAIWGVILALAARAALEGLQPHREMERYRRYAVEVEKAREMFDGSVSTAEKLAGMKEMERQSYLEMAEFMRRNYEARFVI